MGTYGRSWKGIGVGAALALCLTAMAVVAQDRPVTSRQDRPDTLKIHVSGRLAMDYVWRSSEVTFFTSDFLAGAGSDGEGTVEGDVTLRLAAELSDKVSAVIEVGKVRVDTDEIDEFDGGAPEGIALTEAHILVNEFLNPALKAQLGISTWTFDVRGKGRSFAFDPRHSQSINRNWNLIEDDVTDPLVGWGTRADDPGELYPVGAVLTYSKDALTVELVALPMVIEGGRASSDESLYALDFWYNLDTMGKGSRLGAIVAVHGMGGLPGGTGDGDNATGMITVGGGIVLNGMSPGLELYAEGYVQFGDVGQALIGGQTEEVNAKGRAAQVGLEYRLPDNANQIWFGANITYVSGDGDDAASADDNVDNFLSYENVRDLMILEDQYFGFDVDSNYTAIKIMAGASFSLGSGKNNVEIMAIVGLFTTTEDVLDTTGQGEDALGNEVDVRVKYHVNRQLDLNFGFAYLMGSDLVEEAMGGTTAPAAEDNAMLFTAGFDLNF